MADIVLHQWDMSPYCRKVQRILRYKQLPFRTTDYNGILALRVAKLGSIGKLPIIDCDGERIADSSRIAEFIEERHPEPKLFPIDPKQRALAQLWEDWADESLYWFWMYYCVNDPDALSATVQLFCAGRPSWEHGLFRLIFRRENIGKLRAQGLGRLPNAEVDRLFNAHLDRLEATLVGASWLVGNALSIADIAVAAQLGELMRTNGKRDWILARPNLSRWLASVTI